MDKSGLLKEARENPIALRELLLDGDISDALSDIGVLPKVLELHAPSSSSKKGTGLGKTLCGINGTRHEQVTCKKCLQKLASAA